MKDSRRHVFHLLPRLIEDGTTHMVATLLKGMDREKYRITLCGLSQDEADLSSLRDLADDIHILNMHSFFDPRAILPLSRLLKTSGVDVLHTHRIRPDIIGRLAGNMAGTPVNVSTQHYVDEWAERGPVVHRIVRRLFNWSMAHCNMLVCNSAAERELQLQQLDSKHHEKTCVIHNALDTDHFKPPRQVELNELVSQLKLHSADRIISVVAYLTERKGHRYLIEAITSLSAEHPDLKLLIVGDGPEKEMLMRLTENLGIKNQILFLGRRKDIPAILALSEISVLPSLWEPFGLAALEAMAMSTPVIATRVGGLPEFISDGKNGLLVPPADSNSLAAALSKLLENPEQAKDIGLAGHDTVLQGFTARHVAQAYGQLYDRLMSDSV